MKLQKATLFALIAVLDLAADPQAQPSALEIAERHGISAHHLAKVLRTLGRAGIVDAVRGVGGGYLFIGNPKRLTLMDIIALFEPPRAAPPAARPGTGAGEALLRVLNEIDEHAAATFRSITLSTMLKLMRAPVRT